MLFTRAATPLRILVRTLSKKEPKVAKLPYISIRFEDEEQQATITAGFAAYLTWVFSASLGGLSFNAGSSIPRFTELTGSPVPPALVAMILSQGIVLLGFALAARAGRHKRPSKSLLCLSAVAMTSGTALAFAFREGNALETSAAVFGALCSGAGSGVLLSYWGSEFSRLGARRIAISTAISLATAALVYTILAKFVSRDVYQLIASLLPLAQVAFAFSTVSSRSDESEPKASSVNAFPKGCTQFILLLGVSMTMFGVSLGALAASSIVSMHANEDSSSQFAILLVVCTCIPVLLYFVTRKGAETTRWDLILRSMMIIVAIPLFAVSVLPTYAPMLALLLLYLSVLYLFGVLWIYVTGIPVEYRFSPMGVIGVGQGSLSIGVLIGTCLSFEQNLFSSFPTDVTRVIIVSTFIIGYVLNPRFPALSQKIKRASTVKLTGETNNEPVLSSKFAEAETERAEIVSMTKNNLENDTLEERRDAVRIERNAYMDACKVIARQYLLSPRQTEVLYLLARGHNAAHIQNKLCISHSTAKSHIYRIYQKLDVHAQREIIAMVEEVLASALAENVRTAIRTESPRSLETEAKQI